jgi:uncharacterized iron-regulated membrane protein
MLSIFPQVKEDKHGSEWSEMQLNRKIHRWLGIVAVIFFLSVSITGVVLQYQAIFGEEEVAHEAMAALRSPVTTEQSFAIDPVAFERARSAVAARYLKVPGASVDWQIKGETPVFTFHLDGAQPLKVAVVTATGAILSAEPDGESWIIRLHTGEIVGDGGKVLGLLWGLALVAMSVTGFIVYVKMLKARKTGSAGKAKGWRRYFW